MRNCLIHLFLLNIICISGQSSEQNDRLFASSWSVAIPTQVDSPLPDIMDVLVTIKATRLSPANEELSLYGMTRPVYGNKLRQYSLKTISLVFDGIIRIGGLMQTTTLIPPGQVLNTKQFRTIDHSISYKYATPCLELGGFWELGCDLEDIRQYSINFYECEPDIRYHLHPGESYVDWIRDGNSNLTIIQDNIKVGKVVSDYQTIDIKRHGNYRAWLTFRRLNQKITHPSLPQPPLLQKNDEMEAELTEEEDFSEKSEGEADAISELEEPEEVSSLFFVLAEQELRGRQRTSGRRNRSASYSPPRLRDTAYERGAKHVETAFSKIYQGRERYQQEEISGKAIARTIAAYGLDGVGWAVNQLDRVSAGAVTWTSEKMDEGARWTATKLRRGIRDLTGDQRLAQNLGDYAYLGLSAIGPKKFLAPVQTAAKATKATTELTKTAKYSKSLNALDLADSLGVNVKGIKQSWKVRPGQEWKQQIFGKAQRTGTPGHAFKTYRITIGEVRNNPDKLGLLNRSLKRATGEPIRQRPDVTIVEKVDKKPKVHQYEVPSKTDKTEILEQRMEMNKTKFPHDQKGKTKVEHISRETMNGKGIQ
ncbi:hypothetical protein [Candidatus Odyssella thessalonicensis]|uniref:hypothetical protein n=1 Tax=Candidatus Odyssella thessalonicensis TaxID=84647 RepID=UPI001111EEF1|nr:hypothetical protein [Candidatus Odyssella thessalonicensis]